MQAPVFRADERLLTSLAAFGLRKQSTTLEVVRQRGKLEPTSGVESYGAYFWSRFPQRVSGALNASWSIPGKTARMISYR